MIRIGLIGDYDPYKAAHVAIPQALQLAASDLGVQFACDWISTSQLESDVAQQLSHYQAIWAVPGSPYASMQGALNGIRYAREHHVPCLGTCGGFQHMMIEYARNVLGLSEADHAELNPTASLILVAPLTCDVSEQSHAFRLTLGSTAAAVYGSSEIVEQYGICNYGLNPDFISIFEQAGMRVSGVDLNGEIRIMELAQHPFFIGTLFQPERSALRDVVHPLIKAFLRASAEGSLKA